MWPTSLGGRHPAWPAPTSRYGWCDPARGAGSPEPGWLAVPKRTARAARPWPARVARAAQPGWPGRPASVLGAPCFESPGVRSTRGPPWATWSTRAPLLSLAACRQQRLAAMAVDGSGRSARRARKGRRAREGSRPTKAIAATVAAAHAAASIARVTRSAAPSTRARPPALLHPPTRASPAVGLMTIRRAPRRVTGFRRSATLLAGLIWPRQSVAARRCRQVDARSVRDVPAGSGTGASGPVAGRRCRWLQPAPRASRAAGPPSRARPRPLGSASAG